MVHTRSEQRFIMEALKKKREGSYTRHVVEHHGGLRAFRDSPRTGKPIIRDSVIEKDIQGEHGRLVQRKAKFARAAQSIAMRQ